MGCAQSKIDNEESVSRCKDRRNFMKEAVSHRNAFASAHSAYSVALKDTGAALSEYAHGESDQSHPPSDQPQLMILEPTLLPPPPPLPSFSPVTTPLKRSVTMPVPRPSRKMKNVAIAEDEEEEEEENDRDLQRRKNRLTKVVERDSETPVTLHSPLRTPEPPPPPPGMKGMAWDYFFMVENMAGPSSLSEAEDVTEQREENGEVEEEEEVEPKTPEKVGFVTEEEEEEKQFFHSKTAPPDISRGINDNVSNKVGVGSSLSFLDVLGKIDDHFLKASEASQEVSKMLEATRLHYHSNFADNRGHIDHAARVMRVITWNKSFKGVPNSDSVNEDFDAEEYETHATVLDKLLAWEKKLYEEVKAGELLKLEYQRKVALLNKLKKRSASTESLEKTKAALSHLHTRYIVDMQSLDSTVAEVNHIRDDQLYPKLVALVNGMAKMWESMCVHHDNQLNMVTDLKSLDICGTLKETTKHHHDRTIQLWKVIQEWHSQFEKLVTNQKQYIQALNHWLKLNLIPIESSLKEKISSPPRIQNPPIQPLLHSWHDHLEKLPDELAKSAIVSFAAVIKSIIDHQKEEMKLKEKSEETGKEFFRKKQAFDDWYQKYMQRKTPTDETDTDRGDGTNPKDPVSEKQFLVDSLEKQLEEDKEAHRKHCVQVRDKSLGSLKIRLPEIFRAMSDYSHACLDAYERLRTITQSLNANGQIS